MPPSDHVFWNILRQVIVATVFCVVAALNYKNGFDVKDFSSLAMILAALGGFDAAKKVVTNVN